MEFSPPLSVSKNRPVSPCGPHRTYKARRKKPRRVMPSLVGKSDISLIFLIINYFFSASYFLVSVNAAETKTSTKPFAGAPQVSESPPAFLEMGPYLHATPARLLPVKAVEGSAQKIQLNVSWLFPQGINDVQPEYYSIKVDHDNSSMCASNLCYEYYIPENVSSFLIPKDHSTIEGKDCTIKPGCSYTVALTSHPYNGKDKDEKIFKVPDCVGNICNCQFRVPLPAPTVEVQAEGAGVNVTWALSPWVSLPKGVTVKDSELRFGSQIQGVSWFNLTEISNESWSGSSMDARQSKWLNVSLIANKLYQATVTLRDDLRCRGRTGDATIQLDQKEKEKNIVIPIMPKRFPVEYVAVAVAMFALGSALVLCYYRARCPFKHFLAEGRVDALRRQQAWPSAYRMDVNNSQQSSIATTHRCNEERSPLYVEREIAEARERGDADSWEVSPARLRLGRQIGEGAFGRVYLAKMDLPKTKLVAVKKLKSQAAPDEVDEFLKEIDMLKLVGRHEHVVALVGCCTLRQPYCALLEYAAGGDLLRHLRCLRARKPSYLSVLSQTSDFSMSSSYIPAPGTQLPGAHPSEADTEYTTLDSEMDTFTKYISSEAALRVALGGAKSPLEENSSTSCDSSTFGPFPEPDPATMSGSLGAADLHSFALQIARGMEHLEKKKITHRDLAARNVLIGAEGSLKISDLGLSRPGVYVHTRHRKVPLRWLALEAIRRNCYSSKSDVWAYAVLLWEIGTLGGFPYPGLNDMQILGYLSEGMRLNKPDIVSPELYATMIRCWTENPEQRPSFRELVKLLDGDESKNRAYVDISTLQADYIFPPIEEQRKPHLFIPEKQFDKSKEINLEVGKLLKQHIV